MKLKIRLTVIIIAMMLVIITAISTILLYRARTLQKEAAEENLENLTGRHALDLMARLQQYYDSASSLAHIMNSYKRIEPDMRRTQFNECLISVLESNPNYIGLYTVWKPGIIDGRDAEYANTPGTDATGNYITWYYQESSSSSIELRAYENYNDILTYINNPALASIATISNPEYWTLAGKQSLVISINVPIIMDDDKSVVGVVGVNVDLSPAQALIKEIVPYGNGYATMYANDGTIVAHPEVDRIGKKFQEVSLSTIGEKGLTAIEGSLKTGEPARVEYDNQLLQSYPFRVGNATTYWTIVARAYSATVLEAVTTMTKFTIIIAAIAVVAAAVIIFFVATGITKPIVNVSLTLKDISEGEGDLTKSINVKSKDEIGDLARYFNQTLEKIKNMVVIIKQQAVALFDIGNELAS
ncbi:MAG: HAMP domain-containing protein, partial [Treponema sp.]|nr:HAMP domain-containing protein [Treponema sp.]